VHWKRNGRPGARSNMLINSVGAVATGLTTCVVIVAKFVEGAWIATLAIPGLVLLMAVVHRHYESIVQEINTPSPARLSGITPPMVVVPIQRWSRVAEKALRFAYALSQDILVLHITVNPLAESHTQMDGDLVHEWAECVEHPAAQVGLARPQLVVLESPYRFVTTSIVDYILKLERIHPDRVIAVVLPELVERRWIYYLLHHQRTTLLKIMLYIRGNGHIFVADVPWYLNA